MHMNSKSTFFFRYDPTIINSLFCVSLDDMDKIRIIDGNLNHIDAIRNFYQFLFFENTIYEDFSN